MHEIDGKRRIFIQEAGASDLRAAQGGDRRVRRRRVRRGAHARCEDRQEGPEEDDRPRAVAPRGQRAVGPPVLTADLREGSRTDRRAFRPGVATGAPFKARAARTAARPVDLT